jgi:hypothetical protein
MNEYRLAIDTADTLDGGAGNDHFQNLRGYDTYRFGTGDGQDVIEANNGRVLFKPGIGQNDVGFASSISAITHCIKPGTVVRWAQKRAHPTELRRNGMLVARRFCAMR